MVMASNKTTYKFTLEHFRVDMSVEDSLSQSQQMTGLLYAISELKQLSGVSDIQLMFDEDNMTNEEEILQQQITDVMVKPKNMAGMARMQGSSQPAQEQEQDLEGALNFGINIADMIM